jgi:hypothetical protein
LEKRNNTGPTANPGSRRHGGDESLETNANRRGHGDETLKTNDIRRLHGADESWKQTESGGGAGCSIGNKRDSAPVPNAPLETNAKRQARSPGLPYPARSTARL